MGVLHIVGDGGLHLFLALGGVDGFGCPLTDVAGAIELGALATVPDGVERHFVATQRLRLQLFGHDGVAASHTREACRLGIAVELYRHLAGASDLVDGVWYLGIGDVGLVGCVVEDDALVLDGIVHPLAKLVLGDDGASGIVGITEVDHVYTVVGNLGCEVVAFIAGHVHHIAPVSVLEDARASYHHIAVDVDRINGVGDADVVVPSQYLLYVAGVALGSVVDKHLVDIEMDATWQEVVLDNRLAQEVVASLRTVASEGSLHCHLFHCFVHGLDNGRTERLGHVANAQTDDSLLGVRYLVGVHLLGDVGKEIIAGKLQEMFVY